MTQLRQTAEAYTGETYSTIPKDTLEAMKDCLREYRKLQSKGLRSQALSSAHDHRQTMRRVADEVRRGLNESFDVY